MDRSVPVEGFSLAYDRSGEGPAVVLLHGWPGDRRDWREVVARLRDDALTLVVPDLRGFGATGGVSGAPDEAFAAAGQARSVLGLLDELGFDDVVLAGYDVGSRVAQQVVRDAPERVRALVIAPPLPGVGDRILSPDAHREFWYQHFHRLELPGEIVDGHPEAVRAYLAHFWSHWSGPGWAPSEADLDGLVDVYGPPGAFLASIACYRGGGGTVATSLAETEPDPADRLAAPTTILWPAHDPLFPRAWGDRVDAFFAAATVHDVPESGHFVPLEAPDRFAEAIRAAAGTGEPRRAA